MNDNKQSGQILLITLLVIAFAAIVVLSLISRSTVSQNISTQVDDAAKALSAAEAGLELALQSRTQMSGETEEGVNYSVTEPVAIANSNQYDLPEKTPKGDVAVIWLAEHTTDGDGNIILDENPANDFEGAWLDVCWSDNPEPQDDPAVAVSLLYLKKDGSTYEYRVGKAAFDSDPDRRGENNFTWRADENGIADCPSGFIGQKIHTGPPDFEPINNNADTLLALRMRPLYEDARFRITSQGGENIALPAQGNRYTSTGTTSSGTTRAVSVEELYSAPGAIFDYVIYSQTGDFRH